MARRIWKWSKLTVKKEKVAVRAGLPLRHGVHVLPTSLMASVHPPYHTSAPGHGVTTRESTVKMSPWGHKRRHLVGTKVVATEKLSCLDFMFSEALFPSERAVPLWTPLVHTALSQAEHGFPV